MPVRPVLQALPAYLPSPPDRPPVQGRAPKSKRKVGTDHENWQVTERAPQAKAPFCALAFKTVSSKTNDLVYLRVYSGAVSGSDQLLNINKNKKERLGQIHVMHANRKERVEVASAGDIVIVNLREANRNADIFGADAAAFNPDRDVAPGVSETGITFGIGMHACLGKNLAAGTLPTPGKPFDADVHQYGTVAWLTHALLQAGINKDPDEPPELDQAIARETWLRYPVVFDA